MVRLKSGRFWYHFHKWAAMGVRLTMKVWGWIYVGIVPFETHVWTIIMSVLCLKLTIHNLNGIKTRRSSNCVELLLNNK